MGEGDDAGDGQARQSNLDLSSMRKIAIFEQCSDRFVQELLAEMRVERFAAGDVVCREGDVGNCMYFVQRGQLDVSVKEKKVATFTEGCHFGEMALLGGKKRAATVTAISDCDLNAIDRKPFSQVLARSPKEAAIFKGEALRRRSGLKNMRQSIAVSKVLGQNMAQTLAGSGKKAYQMKELSPFQEKNLRICFDAHTGKSGKVNVHDDPDDEDGGISREGARFIGTFHSFGLTRYRQGGKMGAGQGLLEREIEELMEECEDEDVDFIEVKTLASRESYLAAEWKSYHDVRVQEGQVDEDMTASGSSEPWLDPMWQIKESFKILTNSVGDGTGLEIAMLYQVLNTCGEEMDNEEFDEFLQLTKLENTGNVKVEQILAALREYSYADPYDTKDDDAELAKEREKAPPVPGQPIPPDISKKDIIKQAGENMRGSE